MSTATAASAADRAEISRRNGSRSRGPRTAEGKARSRFNALKHGLTARIPVLPGEDPDEFRRRVEDFVEALQPRDAVELHLVQQAAVSSWKVDRADRIEADRAAAACDAEPTASDRYRREQAIALGRWLMASGRDSRIDAARALHTFLDERQRADFQAGGYDHPQAVVFLLQSSAEGCRWMIDQWDALRETYEEYPVWETGQLQSVVTLLGQRPLGKSPEEADSEIEDMMRLRGPDALDLIDEDLRQQLGEPMPEDPAELREAELRLIERETSRLSALAAAYEHREAAGRRDRLTFDASPEAEAMRRHQLACDRSLHRSLHGLLKLRRAEAMMPRPDADDDEEPVAVAADAADVLPDDRDPASEPGPVRASDPWQGTGTDGGRISQNEPSPAAAGDQWPAEASTGGDRIPQNEPSSRPDGDRIPQNEPSPAADGGGVRTDEPLAAGPTAAPAVGSRVLALVLPLVAGLVAAIGASAAGRAGPSNDPRPGPTGPPAVHRESDRALVAIPADFHRLNRKESPRSEDRPIHEESPSASGRPGPFAARGPTRREIRPALSHRAGLRRRSGIAS